MKCLIVDDEFVSLTKMVTILSELGECEAATHSKQAIDIALKAMISNHYYDMIMVDVNLPDVNGLELMQFIINKEKVHNVKPAIKIAISAVGNSVNVRNAISIGCSLFLIKPIKKELIITKLKLLGLLGDNNKNVPLTSLQSNQSLPTKVESPTKEQKTDSAQVNGKNESVTTVKKQEAEDTKVEIDNSEGTFVLLNDAQKFELKKGIKERKKEIFKMCIQDPKMQVLIEAIVDDEMWRLIDDR